MTSALNPDTAPPSAKRPSPGKPRRPSSSTPGGSNIVATDTPAEEGEPTPTTSRAKATPVGSKGKGKGKAAKIKGSGGEGVDKKEEKPGGVGGEEGGGQTERRAARVVAEDSLKYSADSVARCPLPGCDSKGQMCPKFATNC